MQLWTRPLDRPIQNLLIICVAWKFLLLLIAGLSPGPGYDTSASLISPNTAEGRGLPPAIQYILGKLIRWDAIYFVKTAGRGYVFEQEWAFGWGFTRLISLCVAALEKAGIPRYDGLEGLMAIVIAHTAHLFSVLVLFNLTSAVFAQPSTWLAFTAASLHIISPAGLFLSAPYAESSCALLSFVGCFLFTKSLGGNGPVTASHDLLVLLSGISFGIATTFRSNGILNGLLLLEEAFRTLWSLKTSFQISSFRRLIATGLGGVSVAVGFLLPQYIAYTEYCGVSEVNTRTWCKRALPSIYTFVQDHYWHCGLFRYWTISNIPLFLLATPMFVILVTSGLWALKVTTEELEQDRNDVKDVRKSIHGPVLQVIRNLAVSQLMLVMLTSTTAHVQIITRISSAFPVWLWYIAISCREGKTLLVSRIVKFMVIYSVIQGGLYASFLPPA
ncbi:glycosyltransferase family 76 protein [Stipitochalara longipes BDJ]|nr:glycosyltransferase family 76 protein [Stipitochalara longipes BDJ]